MADGIDTAAIHDLAATMKDYGVYAFAAASFVGLVVVPGTWQKILFGTLFCSGAILSAVMTFYPPPEQVRYMRGDFGWFDKKSVPRVLSLDQSFYIAIREDPTVTGLEWAMFLEKTKLSSDHIKIGLYQPFSKTVLDNDSNKKVEEALRGGPFTLPLAPFLDPAFKPDQTIKFKLETNKDYENGLCLSGGPFKEKICNDVPARGTSLERPWLLDRRSFASRFVRWIVPSAHAEDESGLSEDALRAILASGDLLRLVEATKAIEKDPARYKNAINEVLARPIGSNTYAGRLSVIQGLREGYRPAKIIYPNDAQFAWLDDTSLRRIILDSFDRSDVLGESARRFLRSAKSDHIRGLIDRTVGDVGIKVPELAGCLGTLQQDIYVNWAALSLSWLREANGLTEAKARTLAGLMDNGVFPADGSLASSYRLRANYIKADILLEAAVALRQPAGSALENDGLAILRQMQTDIDRLGRAEVEKNYYGSVSELAKVKSFLGSVGSERPLNIQILQKAEGVARAYPSCKI